jgi:hypothetical protein
LSDCSGGGEGGAGVCSVVFDELCRAAENHSVVVVRAGVEGLVVEPCDGEEPDLEVGKAVSVVLA